MNSETIIKTQVAPLTNYIAGPKIAAHQDRIIEAFMELVSNDPDADDFAAFYREQVEKAQLDLMSTLSPDELAGAMSELLVFAAMLLGHLNLIHGKAGAGEKMSLRKRLRSIMEDLDWNRDSDDDDETNLDALEDVVSNARSELDDIVDELS